MLAVDFVLMIFLAILPTGVCLLKNGLSAVKTLPLYILAGLYFALSYYFFRTWGTEFYRFSALYNFMLIFVATTPVVLALMLKGASKKVLWCITMFLSAAVFASPVSRLFLMPKYHSSYLMRFPLHLCNISCLLYLPAVTFNCKTLKNYAASLGLLGGLMMILDGDTYGKGTFYNYIVSETYFMHMFLVIIPLFMVMTNQIDFAPKKALSNLYWLVPFFIGFSFINQKWATNYFFTKPLSGVKWIYDSFPVRHLGNYTLNAGYLICTMVFMITLSALTFCLLYLLKRLSKRCLPDYFQQSQPTPTTRECIPASACD